MGPRRPRCRPQRAPVDPEQLLEPARLADRLARIAPDSVADWPPSREVPSGTAYLCVVDRHGTGVSFIQSNSVGIGSGIGVGEAGFFLHNRGAGFDLLPGAQRTGTRHAAPPHLVAHAVDRFRRGSHHGPRDEGWPPPTAIADPDGSASLLGGVSPADAQSAPRWRSHPPALGVPLRSGSSPRPQPKWWKDCGYAATMSRWPTRFSPDGGRCRSSPSTEKMSELQPPTPG